MYLFIIALILNKSPIIFSMIYLLKIINANKKSICKNSIIENSNPLIRININNEIPIKLELKSITSGISILIFSLNFLVKKFLFKNDFKNALK